jgi:hypothetical protein
MLADQLVDAGADRAELLGCGAPVRGALAAGGGDLVQQPRDADLEELVEVRGEDGQELGALQQRVALVASLVEHARVEVEPRELAVQVRQRCRAPATSGARGANTKRGHAGGSAPGAITDARAGASESTDTGS